MKSRKIWWSLPLLGALMAGVGVAIAATSMTSKSGTVNAVSPCAGL